MQLQHGIAVIIMFLPLDLERFAHHVGGSPTTNAKCETVIIVDFARMGITHVSVCFYAPILR